MSNQKPRHRKSATVDFSCNPPVEVKNSPRVRAIELMQKEKVLKKYSKAKKAKDQMSNRYKRYTDMLTQLGYSHEVKCKLHQILP